MQNMQIDSAAIVAYDNTKFVSAIFKLHHNSFRFRMPKCIRHRFSANAVNLIAYDRMQKPRAPFHDNTKIGLRLNSEVLWETTEGFVKILRTVVGETQAANGIAAIFNHESHQLEDPVEQRPRWRIGAHVIARHVQLHRRTQYSLQQSVMQFLRDSRPFCEPLLKPGIQLTSKFA